MMIQLQGLLSTITFLDVIDIVVVAYFLYRLFLMLKNTRAATLGKGLMVLIGFTLICRWLNLHVISWLLEKSMTVIMVALPVVFQPELRRALEQIGRGKLFHKGSELDEQGKIGLIGEYHDWFRERTAQYGGENCVCILEGDRRNMFKTCPGLILDSYAKCVELLQARGLA